MKNLETSILFILLGISCTTPQIVGQEEKNLFREFFSALKTKSTDLIVLLDASFGSEANLTRQEDTLREILHEHAVIHPSYCRISVIVYSRINSSITLDYITNGLGYKCPLLDNDDIFTGVKFIESSGKFPRILQGLNKANDIILERKNGPHGNRDKTLVLIFSESNFKTDDDPTAIRDTLEGNGASIFVATLANEEAEEFGNAKLLTSNSQNHGTIIEWISASRTNLPVSDYVVSLDDSLTLECEGCNKRCEDTEICLCNAVIGYFKCLCKAGYERGSDNKCQVCPRGSFKSEIGNDKCTLCPGNSQTALAGSTSLGDCQCDLQNPNSCTDYCQSRPCLDFYFTCVNKIDSFECVCRHGLTGDQCDKPAPSNTCSSITCQNGTCEEGLGGPSCRCRWGYKGEFCEQDIDDCKENLCHDDKSVCKDGLSSYSCLCAEGHCGKYCTEECEDEDGIGLGLIIGVAALFAVLVIVIIIVAAIFIHKYKNRETHNQPETGNDLRHDMVRLEPVHQEYDDVGNEAAGKGVEAGIENPVYEELPGETDNHDEYMNLQSHRPITEFTPSNDYQPPLNPPKLISDIPEPPTIEGQDLYEGCEGVPPPLPDYLQNDKGIEDNHTYQDLRECTDQGMPTWRTFVKNLNYDIIRHFYMSDVSMAHHIGSSKDWPINREKMTKFIGWFQTQQSNTIINNFKDSNYQICHNDGNIIIGIVHPGQNGVIVITKTTNFVIVMTCGINTYQWCYNAALQIRQFVLSQDM